MSHDIFISYSSKDKPIADRICASLEAAGLRCWIAPRDIAAGEEWPKAITNAIAKSRVMVLVFSSNSNASSDVGREIVLAANQNLVIIPFKIENVEPEPGKQYYLAQTHWLDAMNPPTLEQIQTLLETVRAVVPTVATKVLLQSSPIPKKVPSQPAATRKNPPRAGYLWIVAALLIVILWVAFWPKVQGMLASATTTPGLTATETLHPTTTTPPTATATETLMPSSTHTTGTVTGKVMWGEQPFEGVTLKLCADPVFTGYCKEVVAEIVTDAQGQFAFNEVDPGKYNLISFSPGDLGLMFHKDVFPLEVAAGQTLTIDPIQQCKYNFSAQTPVLNKDNSVTLRWSDYPSGKYHWFFEDIYTGGVREYWVNYRSVTTRDLDPGQYLFLVEAAAYDGMGSSCSIMWFTIP